MLVIWPWPHGTSGFDAHAPECHRLGFVQSSTFPCIMRKPKSQLIVSLLKVTTNMCQKVGFSLLTQGYGAFSLVHIVSELMERGGGRE